MIKSKRHGKAKALSGSGFKQLRVSLQLNQHLKICLCAHCSTHSFMMKLTPMQTMSP